MLRLIMGVCLAVFGALSLTAQDYMLLALGGNASGQLGVGDTAGRTVPVVVLSGVRDVSAGLFHTLVLKSDGSVVAMGENSLGQLGAGSTTPTRSTSPIPVATGMQAVAAGGAAFNTGCSFFLTTGGQLRGVGSNASGQLGLGTLSSTLTQQVVAEDVEAVWTGYGSTFFRKTNGELWCMGANALGQLGLGHTNAVTTPTLAPYAASSIAIGTSHTVVLRPDGSVWTSGSNTSNQLGTTSSVASSSTPLRISEGATSIAACAEATLFVAGGRLYGAGANSKLVFGMSPTGSTRTPVQLTSIATTAIVGGPASSFVQLEAGRWWSAGTDSSGELGVRTTETTTISVPQRTCIAGGASTVKTAANHAFFLWTAEAYAAPQVLPQFLQTSLPIEYTLSPVQETFGAPEGFQITLKNIGCSAVTVTGTQCLGTWPNLMGFGTVNQSLAPFRTATVHAYLDGPSRGTFGFTLRTLTPGNGLGYHDTPLQALVKAPVFEVTGASGGPLVAGDTLNLGSVAIGGNVATTITLRNTGDGVLTLYSPIFVGAGSAAFSATFPTSIQPGSSSVVTVRYAPTTSGPHTAQLALNSSDIGTRMNLFVRGTTPGAAPRAQEEPPPPFEASAVALPELKAEAVSTTPVVYAGSVLTCTHNGNALTAGQTATLRAAPTGSLGEADFVLRNTGATALASLTFELSGTDSAEYLVVGTPAASLAANATMTLRVGCRPSQLGQRNATLRVLAGSPAAELFSLTLQTTGLEPGGWCYGLGSNCVPQAAVGGALVSTTEPIALLRNAKSVASGSSFTVVIDENDNLLGWGSNGSGELGTPLGSVPAPRLLATQVAAVSAVDSTVAYITADRRLWVLGYNPGTQASVSVPKLLASDVREVVVLSSAIWYLASDFTVRAVYHSSYPSLGSRLLSRSTLGPPRAVAANVSSIRGGYSHGLFFGQDGSLYGVGSNQYGQLGVGVATSSDLPPVRLGTGCVDAIGSVGFTALLDSQGRLFGTGNILGAPSGSASYSPYLITEGATAMSLPRAQYIHLLWKTRDHALWGRGDNTRGQLGQLANGATSVASPVLLAMDVDRFWTGLWTTFYTAAPNSPDSDGDGLPDGWELRHFGDLSPTTGGDSDGDGVGDRDEQIAGTNPRNAASLPSGVFSFANNGGTFRYGPITPGRTYVVESSPDLTTWSRVNPTSPAVLKEGYHVVPLPASALPTAEAGGALFLRARAALPGNGITAPASR